MNTSLLTIVCASRLVTFKTSALAVVAMLIAFFAWKTLSPNSVHPDEAGQAVYVEGEACTVNYTPDRALFQARLDWCAAWYRRDHGHPLRP